MNERSKISCSVFSVIRVVTCHRRGKFYTSMASFTRMRRHSSDLSDEVFELNYPLLRLVSSLIHDFFRVSPNRKCTQGGKLPPSFLLLCSSSSTRSSRVFRSERNFRIALVCGRGNASTLLNVRFYYDITMNYCRGKFVRCTKNTSIDNVYVRNLMAFFSYGIFVN